MMKFKEKWLKLFDWLSPVENDIHNAKCEVCSVTINIKWQGRHALTIHAAAKKHLKNLRKAQEKKRRLGSMNSVSSSDASFPVYSATALQTSEPSANELLEVKSGNNNQDYLFSSGATQLLSRVSDLSTQHQFQEKVNSRNNNPISKEFLSPSSEKEPIKIKINFQNILQAKSLKRKNSEPISLEVSPNLIASQHLDPTEYKYKSNKQMRYSKKPEDLYFSQYKLNKQNETNIPCLSEISKDADVEQISSVDQLLESELNTQVTENSVEIGEVFSLSEEEKLCLQVEESFLPDERCQKEMLRDASDHDELENSNKSEYSKEHLTTIEKIAITTPAANIRMPGIQVSDQDKFPFYLSKNEASIDPSTAKSIAHASLNNMDYAQHLSTLDDCFLSSTYSKECASELNRIFPSKIVKNLNLGKISQTNLNKSFEKTNASIPKILSSEIPTTMICASTSKFSSANEGTKDLFLEEEKKKEQEGVKSTPLRCLSEPDCSSKNAAGMFDSILNDFSIPEFSDCNQIDWKTEIISCHKRVLVAKYAYDMKFAQFQKVLHKAIEINSSQLKELDYLDTIDDNCILSGKCGKALQYFKLLMLLICDKTLSPEKLTETISSTKLSKYREDTKVVGTTILINGKPGKEKSPVLCCSKQLDYDSENAKGLLDSNPNVLADEFPKGKKIDWLAEIISCHKCLSKAKYVYEAELTQLKIRLHKAIEINSFKLGELDYLDAIFYKSQGNCGDLFKLILLLSSGISDCVKTNSEKSLSQENVDGFSDEFHISSAESNFSLSGDESEFTNMSNFEDSESCSQELQEE